MPDRLDLRIDIFEKTDQHALVLPEVTPQELVSEILKEFRELEYLGVEPEQYRLVRAGEDSPLQATLPLGRQLSGENRFVLQEQEIALPEQTRPMSQPIYLREQRTGKTYRLPWQPAIIGRVSDSQPLNRQVAVDLRDVKEWARVSRRHARIIEVDGTFFIELLVDNPISLIRDQQTVVSEAMEGRFPLQHGDMIRLDRSGILLKFIIRPSVSSTASSDDVVPDDEAATPPTLLEDNG